MSNGWPVVWRCGGQCRFYIPVEVCSSVLHVDNRLFRVIRGLESGIEKVPTSPSRSHRGFVLHKPYPTFDFPSTLSSAHRRHLTTSKPRPNGSYLSLKRILVSHLSSSSSNLALFLLHLPISHKSLKQKQLHPLLAA